MGCLDMAIPTEYRFDGTSGPSLITSVPGGILSHLYPLRHVATYLIETRALDLLVFQRSQVLAVYS